MDFETVGQTSKSLRSYSVAIQAKCNKRSIAGQDAPYLVLASSHKIADVYNPAVTKGVIFQVEFFEDSSLETACHFFRSVTWYTTIAQPQSLDAALLRIQSAGDSLHVHFIDI